MMTPPEAARRLPSCQRSPLLTARWLFARVSLLPDRCLCRLHLPAWVAWQQRVPCQLGQTANAAQSQPSAGAASPSLHGRWCGPGYLPTRLGWQAASLNRFPHYSCPLPPAMQAPYQGAQPQPEAAVTEHPTCGERLVQPPWQAPAPDQAQSAVRHGRCHRGWSLATGIPRLGRCRSHRDCRQQPPRRVGRCCCSGR